MAKKLKKSTSQPERSASTKQKKDLSNQPWLSMRTGLTVMGVVSLGMAALTAYNAIPSVGIWEGILWGILFGGSLWLVFLIAFLFHRFMRRGSSE